jgi:hypothetical protein
LDALKAVGLLILGFIIYEISFHFFSFFIAQFLLPIFSIQERFDGYNHFLQFHKTNHGPLIFVRDGEEIAHYGERERKGPGVLLIDSNSAAVVGGEIHGPGIAFTEGREINKIIDLRKLVRSKTNVHAFTRDGIEILSNVKITFSLSSPPQILYVAYIGEIIANNIVVVNLDDKDERIIGFSHDELDRDEQLEIHRVISGIKSEKEVDVKVIDIDQTYASKFVEERVRNAFNNQARRIEDGEKIDWTDHPLDIAIEEFRNTIVRYPFDDLFVEQRFDQDNLEGKNEIRNPIIKIKEEFTRRVKNSGMLAYHFLERIDGHDFNIGDRISEDNVTYFDTMEFEHPRPLRKSSITVHSVQFGELVPANQEVHMQTVKNLVARWEAEAHKTEIGFNEQAALIRSRAKAQVQQDTVYALSDILKKSDKIKTALILRIFQALESAAADSTNDELEKMINILGDLRKWFTPNEQEKLVKQENSDNLSSDENWDGTFNGTEE